ncbi:Transcriptional activator protein LuxR [Methylococcales bacterium]|nr:Transcriptional activator protein LuxR [Methylococcales bacterium]
MNIDKFNGTLQSFLTASSIEEITELCRFHCQHLGFDAFVYALRIPTNFADSKLVLIKGYPEPWLEHYFTNAYYDIDPIIAYCSKYVTPIQWDDLTKSISSQSIQMMNEAGEFGLKAGITMPMHGPHGELGILSFALNRPTLLAREITQHAMPYVQLLAGYLHEAMWRVLSLENVINMPPLTTREQECLKWVADGKTSWEISKLLSVSERTINFHLNNAILKLQASNRQHAVTKAILQGLIHPHPF